MASGSSRNFIGSFIGVADDVEIELPFTPRSIKFLVDVSGTLEDGWKTADMAGDAYLSTTTGTDAGVTIGNRSVTVANGADINSVGNTVYFEAWE